MAAHGTSKNRARKQKLKERYSKAREDAQLHGIIPTEPEGALKPEKVDPATQEAQSLPALDRQAIREDWSVPGHVKHKVIERLAEPFFEEGRVVLDKSGNQITLPPDRQLLKENAKVLLLADQRQYERDNPEAAGKAKGASQQSSTNINNNTTNVLVADLADFFKTIDARRAQPGYEPMRVISDVTQEGQEPSQGQETPDHQGQRRVPDREGQDGYAQSAEGDDRGGEERTTKEGSGNRDGNGDGERFATGGF